MARGDAEVRIRIPHELKAWLKEEATRNLRTQNAQIVALLQEAKATQEATGQK